ncbi:MAG: hypothetical protein K0Q93_1076 [Nocardioidaceae bacterium]|nr:hypothetical protein [Nocardioidaceae bacterium]
MYEALLWRMTAELGTGGPLDRVVAGHEDAPGPSAVALRLLGTVHRLVLERRAEPLARYYPSTGGHFDLDAAWPLLEDLLDERSDDVVSGLARPPQTNEVGRAAALVGALLRVPGAELPVRLFELGASAGLNLRADHYRYSGAGGAWGPPDSPVRLAAAWAGVSTPTDRRLHLVERTGCDPAPIDPTTPSGRILLSAYVWADQSDRLERLRCALDVAARVPAEVRRQPAGEFVADLRLEPGHCTVLWHSVMWQYVDPAEQAVLRDHVRRLAGQSSPDSPFAHVYLEPTRRAPGADHEFLVVDEQWSHQSTGPARILGTAAAHGLPVTWER